MRSIFYFSTMHFISIISRFINSNWLMNISFLNKLYSKMQSVKELNEMYERIFVTSLIFHNTEQTCRCNGNARKSACYWFFNRATLDVSCDVLISPRRLSLDYRSNSAARKPTGNWERYANSGFIMSAYTWRIIQHFLLTFFSPPSAYFLSIGADTL